MGYTFKDWSARHRDRIDISGSLTHLTREAKIDGVDVSPVAVLVKILREQQILGSDTNSGFIVGPRRAVCFQDAPLLGLAQNVRFERRNGSISGRVRYRGVGIVFSKVYAFQRGARPVLYEKTESAKKLLSEEEHWRIVRLDLSDDSSIVDWSHEREWRAPDIFKFERRHCAVVLDSKADYKEFLSTAADVAAEIVGVSVLAHAVA